MKTLITSILLSLLFVVSSAAQKFGHINTQIIIQALPEVKTADAELESYSKQLINKGQEMVTTYESALQDYSLKANNGELSQIQMQQAEAQLTEEQTKIRNYEVEVQQLVATKKQEVYQPILDKIQKVIDEVGKEMGYTMIFDSSSLAMVFAEDTEDLMPIVKQRLGLQ